MADVLPPPATHLTEKIVHPFFNKDARLVEEAGNSDGDFPTPSSAHSSDYEDSGNDDPQKQKPIKKRRKDLGGSTLLPSPPRSSENEALGLSRLTLVDLTAQSTLPPVSNDDSDPKPANNAGLESKIDVLTGGPIFAPTARSAFELMKQSSVGMTKTRSRSMSPPPLGADGPPMKKARTRGRPRKSGLDDSDFAAGDRNTPSTFTLPAVKPSLVVRLKIGKEAAARLSSPPEKKSLVVTLKLDKNKLEIFVPKPHPFFMKAKEKRKQAILEEATSKSSTNPIPTSKPPPNFLSIQREPKPKFKTEYLAAWPSKENTHVRNISGEEILSKPLPHGLRSSSFQKGKARTSAIAPAESALNILKNSYSRIYHQHAYHDDPIGPPVPRPTIRIPERKLQGPEDIMAYIRKQIPNSRLYSPDIHPAIKELAGKVGNKDLLITAFDRDDCETQTWTSLYAPTSSDCVLQTGHEANELSKWLACMKITSVDTGVNSKPKVLQVKKKKKPKNELDDFVVSEEDENDSMDELTDPEDVNALFPNLYSSKSLRKSEIRRKSRSAVSSVATNTSRKPRTSSPPPRLPNAILLSGPSGVGKTAAVYAAAKEHDFVVFEINAGTKRGGKEIQEMVGDMSRNHLVHQAKSNDQPTNPELELFSKPASNDFGSFFAKKAPAQPKLQEDGQTEDLKEKEKVQQQQSLILIEEADILFEEDNGFWRSITTLIQKSRRPVVITCNNESVLPTEDLDLYAKLRFKPASPDLAADYLLLMTAAQGHFLDRSTILRLYESYDYDLRRTITQLSFWCQMAVGDHTWCGRWFYTRDDKSNTEMVNSEIKRSISGGTYLPEMGSFGRELLVGENGHSLLSDDYDEIAVWKDVIESTGVDLKDRFHHGELEKWMETTENDLSHLAPYGDYIESLSMLDAYGGFGTFTDEHIRQPIDTRKYHIKLRKTPESLIGVKTVHADKKVDPSSTSTLLSLTGHILARNVLHDLSKSKMKGGCDILFAPYTEFNIVHMISSNRHFRERYQKKHEDELRYPFEKIMNGQTQLVRPVKIVVETIPYIREIARFDQQNEEIAREMSSLISQRPGAGKKRTTRASAFAFEGRNRGGGRPRNEQYFRGSLGAMVGTGGKDWGEVVYTYTQRPEPEEESAEEEKEAQANEDAWAGAVKLADELRNSRRKIIHDDDIEEWSSDV
ncbi:hypothetical protein ABW20_dc0107130 [Dactylellina cionopaga]|nr:hypothetical protein ABW20_dc0107130 [Dactylellina cionopaga]